jgi:hypothetical protein
VINTAALQQIDDVAVYSRAEHMGTHHQHPRRTHLSGCLNPAGNLGKLGMMKRRRLLIKRQPLLAMQVAHALLERQQP